MTFEVIVKGDTKDKDPDNYEVGVRTYEVEADFASEAATKAGCAFRTKFGLPYIVSEVRATKLRK